MAQGNDACQVKLRPSPEGDGLLHASCVAIDRRALVIAGASGTGKSAVALDLISRGAQLVSDDQLVVVKSGNQLLARAPEALSGQIEARHIGILRAPPVANVPICLWVNLDQTEQQRLPEHHTILCLGVQIPLLFHVASPHLGPALLQYLKHGRSA